MVLDTAPLFGAELASDEFDWHAFTADGVLRTEVEEGVVLTLRSDVRTVERNGDSSCTRLKPPEVEEP